VAVQSGLSIFSLLFVCAAPDAYLEDLIQGVRVFLAYNSPPTAVYLEDLIQGVRVFDHPQDKMPIS